MRPGTCGTELALVLNTRGAGGVHAGNDMSSRDIEGENLLYLPQAKVYRASCASVRSSPSGPRRGGAGMDHWDHGERGGVDVFEGETGVSKIKRGFDRWSDGSAEARSSPGCSPADRDSVVPPNEFTLSPPGMPSISTSLESAGCRIGGSGLRISSQATAPRRERRCRRSFIWRGPERTGWPGRLAEVSVPHGSRA